MGTEARTQYCLCCDDKVPVSLIDRGDQREVICSFCGFTLEVLKTEEPKAREEKGHALVADDSKYTRRIIEDVIREKGLFAGVRLHENGLELISDYGDRLAEGSAVDVAIIDLNMPVMDGLTAAKTMRALEERHKARKVPIVFFSGKKADEELKRQMDSLAPANYVNKGNDPDPDRLASRVESLLNYLVERHGQSAI